MTKTALISVSDKTGVVAFAQKLTQLGWRIVSTGGTHRTLHEAGIKNLLEVSDLTGFPEGLEGRIKTLTPQIFGGILYLRGDDLHEHFMEENTLPDIDMVVVNLYPFKKNYLDDTKDWNEKIEQIDIGGPSMIRAAAKNYQFCAPVVDPADYETILTELQQNGDIAKNTRKILAAKVFEMTAHYDLLIAKFWVEQAEKMPLRYGENPHQSAVILNDPFATGANLVQAKVLNGKPLSYNNFNDGNSALELALSFAGEGSPAFATIFKHATPCGAAIGKTIEEAFTKAYENDPLSAFGGVMAFNRTVSPAVAEKIVSFFNEIVIAPDYEPAALDILKTKKNLRVLQVDEFSGQTPDFTCRRVRGGTLVQALDTGLPNIDDLKTVTKKTPTPQERLDLGVAWKLVKIVKSNAIVVVKDGTLIGQGGGQTSRVDAMKIALERAGKSATGAVIASDAFSVSVG